jgi:hypothetical protein
MAGPDIFDPHTGVILVDGSTAISASEPASRAASKAGRRDRLVSVSRRGVWRVAKFGVSVGRARSCPVGSQPLASEHGHQPFPTSDEGTGTLGATSLVY